MRLTLIILGAACLLASGCKAMNSLIFHPVHVVYEQHEYNEKEKRMTEELAKEWAPESLHRTNHINQ